MESKEVIANHVTVGPLIVLIRKLCNVTRAELMFDV